MLLSSSTKEFRGVIHVHTIPIQVDYKPGIVCIPTPIVRELRKWRPRPGRVMSACESGPNITHHTDTVQSSFRGMCQEGQMFFLLHIVVRKCFRRLLGLLLEQVLPVTLPLSQKMITHKA